jgi:hypothetical protein
MNPCSFIGGDWHFRGTCCLHHQNRWSSYCACYTTWVSGLIYPEDGGSGYIRTPVHIYQTTRRNIPETAVLIMATNRNPVLTQIASSAMAMKVLRCRVITHAFPNQSYPIIRQTKGLGFTTSGNSGSPSGAVATPHLTSAANRITISPFRVFIRQFPGQYDKLFLTISLSHMLSLRRLISFVCRFISILSSSLNSLVHWVAN